VHRIKILLITSGRLTVIGWCALRGKFAPAREDIFEIIHPAGSQHVALEGKPAVNFHMASEGRCMSKQACGNGVLGTFSRVRLPAASKSVDDARGLSQRGSRLTLLGASHHEAQHHFAPNACFEAHEEVSSAIGGACSQPVR
jgi:hypothetical protein